MKHAKPIAMFSFLLLIASVAGGAPDKSSDELKTDKVEVIVTQSQQEAAQSEALPQTGDLPDVKATKSPNAGPYDIKWQVISRGGTEGTSTNYKLRGTLDQTAVGEANSGVLQVLHGFWQDFSGGGCCIGIRGNANGDEGEDINISDITYLVDYLFGIPLGPAPPCPEEGNANGDGSGDINISDITYLVEYLFGIPLGLAPPACP